MAANINVTIQVETKEFLELIVKTLELIEKINNYKLEWRISDVNNKTID